MEQYEILGEHLISPEGHIWWVACWQWVGLELAAGGTRVMPHPFPPLLLYILEGGFFSIASDASLCIIAKLGTRVPDVWMPSTILNEDGRLKHHFDMTYTLQVS